MNKNAEKYGLMVLAVVAVVAVIGLATYFGNQTAVGAAAFQSKTWGGTVRTEEQVVSDSFTTLPGYNCAVSVYAWASGLAGEKAAYRASIECGDCCADAVVQGALDSNDVDLCSTECKGAIKQELFRTG